MVYQWKIPMYKVNAQAAGEELERIAKAQGSLRPEAIVAASKDENAVLHGCFEWNDQKAAEGYRNQQAQHIIRNIVTVSIKGVDSNNPVRAFVNIQNDYKPIAAVIVSADYTQELLQAAYRELKDFREKYASLKQLSAVFASIDQLDAAQ